MLPPICIEQPSTHGQFLHIMPLKLGRFDYHRLDFNDLAMKKFTHTEAQNTQGGANKNNREKKVTFTNHSKMYTIRL